MTVDFLGDSGELEGIVIGVRSKMLGQPASHIVLHEQGQLWYRKTYALDYMSEAAGTGVTTKAKRVGFTLLHFIPPLARRADLDTLGLTARDRAKLVKKKKK